MLLRVYVLLGIPALVLIWFFPEITISLLVLLGVFLWLRKRRSRMRLARQSAVPPIPASRTMPAMVTVVEPTPSSQPTPPFAVIVPAEGHMASDRPAPADAPVPKRAIADAPLPPPRRSWARNALQITLYLLVGIPALYATLLFPVLIIPVGLVLGFLFLRRWRKRRAEAQTSRPRLPQQTASRDFSGVVQFSALLGLLPMTLDLSLFTHFSLKAPPGLEILGSLPLFAGGGIGLIPYPVAVIICLVKRQWGWLCFGLFFAHMSAIMLLTRGLGGSDAGYGLLVVASKISLSWIVYKGRLLSPSFLVFPLLVLIGAIVGAFWSLESLKLLVLLLPLLAFALVVLTLRFLVLAIAQNFSVLWEIGLVRTFGLMARSFVYWSPLLLLALPAELITREIHEAFTTGVYDKTFINRYGPSKDMESDLIKSIASEAENAKAKWHARVENLTGDLRNPALPIDQYDQRVCEEFDAVFPMSLELKSRNYDGFWGPLKDQVSETVVEELEAGYSKTRQSARKGLQRELNQRVEVKAHEGRDAVLNDIVPQIQTMGEEAIESARQKAQNSVQLLYSGMRGFRIVSAVLFVFLCIRSYLYVFGRTAFTEDSGAFISLGAKLGAGATATGSIKLCGQQYKISGSDLGDYFVSRRFEPHGKAPQFALPQPGAAAVARLRNHAFTMNRLHMDEARFGVYFTSVQGSEFIEWNIPEDVTVIFDFRHFVAMSEGIRLSSLISFRISTLLFGRVSFSTATGPGRLILITTGRPVAGDNEESNASIPANRLVAWMQNARFSIESELNLVDIYMSGVYVRRIGSEHLIFDADSKGNSNGGIAKFVRYFLLPF
jgi:hypothetical protein